MDRGGLRDGGMGAGDPIALGVFSPFSGIPLSPFFPLFPRVDVIRGTCKPKGEGEEEKEVE
jgi:hypothetical protein